jgi:hypothetical protein
MTAFTIAYIVVIVSTVSVVAVGSAFLYYIVSE